MNDNTRRAFSYWQHGIRLKAHASIWTDGKRLYSYDTCLVDKLTTQELFLVNVSKYSSTTSKKRNQLITLLEAAKLPFLRITDVPEGTTSLTTHAVAAILNTPTKD